MISADDLKTLGYIKDGFVRAAQKVHDNGLSDTIASPYGIKRHQNPISGQIGFNECPHLDCQCNLHDTVVLDTLMVKWARELIRYET